MTKRIVVFGATKGIGKLVVDEALTAGYAVRAFARSADTLAPRDGMEACAGDALDPADVARALKGADAVIYALGIKERPAMLWQPETLFSETTKVLLPAMAEAGVKRLLVVTGFGAGRSRASMSALERVGHNALLGRVYADKHVQEEMVMASDLDWTIVRPVILTKGPKSGGYKVLRDAAEWRNGLIPRADVASYLVDAVKNEWDVRRDVVLAR